MSDPCIVMSEQENEMEKWSSQGFLDTLTQRATQASGVAYAQSIECVEAPPSLRVQ